MDLDASERRAHRRRRRRPETQAAVAGADSGTSAPMNKRPQLYVIQEPETVERKVLHLSGGIRVHGPAEARDVAKPWPRQHAWRDAVRRIKKSGD
jgi:hypothetical protein